MPGRTKRWYRGEQPAALVGALDIDMSIKAARFVRTCDCFNVTLVPLDDVSGFLPGAGQEHGGIVKCAAELLYAYPETTVPKLTVITPKARAGACHGTNSRHTRGDMDFAWPTAEIEVTGAVEAVNITVRDEIARSTDPVAEQRRLLAELEAESATRTSGPPAATSTMS